MTLKNSYFEADAVLGGTEETGPTAAVGGTIFDWLIGADSPPYLGLGRAPKSIQVHESARHEEGIQPVQHASVTRNDFARIFDTRRALQQGLAEIAQLAEEPGDEGEHDGIDERDAGQEPEMSEERAAERAAERAEEALDRLLRANRFIELVFAEIAAGEIAARVGEPGEHDRHEHVARAERALS